MRFLITALLLSASIAVHADPAPRFIYVGTVDDKGAWQTNTVDGLSSNAKLSCDHCTVTLAADAKVLAPGLVVRDTPSPKGHDIGRIHGNKHVAITNLHVNWRHVWAELK